MLHNNNMREQGNIFFSLCRLHNHKIFVSRFYLTQYCYIYNYLHTQRIKYCYTIITRDSNVIFFQRLSFTWSQIFVTRFYLTQYCYIYTQRIKIQRFYKNTKTINYLTQYSYIYNDLYSQSTHTKNLNVLRKTCKLSTI